MRSLFFFFLTISLLDLSCNAPETEKWFTRLDPGTSGITFRNDINDKETSYSFINEFGYMGGGVGIGDFNNDGLQDIFLTGNQVSSRLYVNLGNNKFEDITEKAGLNTKVWCTGVSIVDINQDGYDDIYVAVFGKDLTKRSHNLLFINQGDLTFREQAVEYNLADSGYSTQAVFLDYDRDGDLDMYLVNYLLSTKNGNSIFPKDKTGRSPANDRLYRNEGDRNGDGHPVFTDVTLDAGIKEDGYGLGVTVSDFNKDGWPDIYVANDFVSDDLLWLNNRDGSFTNVNGAALRHQSYSSMGADAADINNDGWPDIMSLDMLPEYNERKKISFSFMNYERYQAERSMGYEPQFMRNMLQLNNGKQIYGNTHIPFFSEIGELSGVEATDWSWSVLLADFDNDGWKDIHITNGIGRDFINADFLEYSQSIFSSNAMTKEEQQEAIRKKLSSLEHVKLPNYLYINQKNLQFKDESESAGINSPSMSNGAAYVDLDNDGDLDLVVNNINEPAFVFLNNTNTKNKPHETHYLTVHLKGDANNRKGFGARVFVYTGNEVQFQEQNPARGYFSSVDQRLLFGLGKTNRVDSVIVIWQDQKKQIIRDISADTSIGISWQNALEKEELQVTKPVFLFSDITRTSGVEFVHRENIFNDFAQQRLLPQKYSQQGPRIAIGDVDKDGILDFFIGGAFNFSGKLFRQNEDQSFRSYHLIDSVKFEEDIDCIFLDVNNDGLDDLLISGGDVQYEENSPYYKPRLYVNDGKGRLNLQTSAFADSVRTIAGTVSCADFNGDGLVDLFIGGRVSKRYPEAPRSFLLQNSNGVFSDVTEKICPELQNIGMVTSSVWTDFDGDGKQDLIVAGDWMPLRFFKNDGHKLLEVSSGTGLSATNGMWRSLVATDMDNDGDMDLIAGNLGLNNSYRVSEKEPMQLFAADLDENGSIEPIYFYYIKNSKGKRMSFPGISRSQFADQMPAIKKQFLLHGDYAKATSKEILKGKDVSAMLQLSCDELRSCYFENIGGGKFVKHPLPVEAQFAPVNAILCDDFDGDGIKDILVAGNEYQIEVMHGPFDASYGCFLKGEGQNKFLAISPVQSGFWVKGDVKDLKMITQKENKNKLVLVAVNNDSLRVFRVKGRP